MIYLTFSDNENKFAIECPNEDVFNEVAMDMNSRIGYRNLRKNVKGKFDKDRIVLSYKDYKDSM